MSVVPGLLALVLSSAIAESEEPSPPKKLVVAGKHYRAGGFLRAGFLF